MGEVGGEEKAEIEAAEEVEIRGVRVPEVEMEARVDMEPLERREGIRGAEEEEVEAVAELK